tara:strand:- start:121 stop:432 length:312 start_codon:yes stop_codon:yes gene_type:complete
MVNKYAVIKNGVVDNVIVLDSALAATWEHGGDEFVQSDTAGTGDLYAGGKFTRPVAVEDYREQRKAEYPEVGDQFDMQYHDGVNGTTTWADAIAAVKTKYPKS